MYNSVITKLIITFLIVSSQATLSADVEQQLVNCTQIKSNVERLACYDNISQNLSSESSNSLLPNTNKIAAAQYNESKPVTANPDASESSEPKVKIIYIEKPAEPLEIYANLVGDFKGWNPNSVFVLDNGQVWRAVRGNARTKRLPNAISNPKISITPGALGSSNFRVDGMKGKLKVKRVK